MKNAVLAVLLFATLSLPALSHAAGLLEFMDGRWQGTWDGHAVVTHNVSGNQNTFVGRTTFFNKAGIVEYVVLMNVEVKGENLVLTLYPMGKKGPSLVTNVSGNKSVTFVNPKSDYPSKVTFALDANGNLLTHLEGIQNGKPMTVDYRQVPYNY